MSTTTGKLKLRLRIFNVILIALSTLSICWLAIFPFLEVKANYKITADTVKEVMKDINEEDVDVEDIVGDGIDLTVKVSITPKMLVKSITNSDSKKYVEEDVIAPIVDDIIEQLMPTIKEIAERAVKSTAKKQLTDYLQDSFDQAFGEENTDVKAKLEEAGINVDQVIDTVYNSFTTEGATVDSVVNTLVTEINAIGQTAYEHFEELGEWQDISEEDKADFTETIRNVLDEVGLVGEHGEILDFDQMLSVLIDKAMGTTSSTESEHIAESTAIDPLNRVYAEELSEEEQAEEETESLADKVKNLIYDKIPAGIEGKIGLILQITAGVLGLFLLTWAFVGVFALLKTIFARNPGIFTGLICFISALLQIILGIVLVYGLQVLQSGKLDIEVINNLLSNVPAGLSVALISSTTIPAFCLLGKFVLTWFYHPTKRRLKKRLNAE